MTPQERAALQALVVSERGAMAATEADLASQHQAVVDASAHANLDDEHDPEGATVGFERARVASLLSHARSRLAELDDAAERLHDGTYGTCERCGQPIAFERLSAYPSAVLCMRCAHASAPSPLDDGGGHATSRRR